MVNSLPIAQTTLAYLNALQWSYKTAHWAFKSYQDHLLFDRLYEAAQEGIDQLAERSVGEWGVVAVDPKVQAGAFADFLTEVGPALFQNPLAALWDCEQVLQVLLRDLKEALEQDGKLNLGFDDLLASMSARHDTSRYLLRQALGPQIRLAVDLQFGLKTAANSAETYFMDNPLRREVYELALSKAVSNMPAIDASPDAPPTPAEIRAETPGSQDFSTLSRLVVTTQQTSESGVPEGLADVPKASAPPDLVRIAAETEARYFHNPYREALYAADTQESDPL